MNEIEYYDGHNIAFKTTGGNLLYKSQPGTTGPHSPVASFVVYDPVRDPFDIGPFHGRNL